jgi:hypothetical protein
MTKTIKSTQPIKETKDNIRWNRFSDIKKGRTAEVLDNCYILTDSIYKGLDLKIEIQSVENQKLGDTILLIDNKSYTLKGLAICHCGPKTEAGSDTCYIKFGSVKVNEESSESNFEKLLDYCEQFAASQGLSKLTAGVNVGNFAAYRKMISKGFRTEFQGVLMTKNNEPGYHADGFYAIDDWR